MYLKACQREEETEKELFHLLIHSLIAAVTEKEPG